VIPFAPISFNHIFFCSKFALHQVMPYFLVVLSKCPLFIVETIDFRDVSWLFLYKHHFVLSWVLSHFIFWFFFGLLVFCITLPLFTFVSCDTCDVPVQHEWVWNRNYVWLLHSYEIYVFGCKIILLLFNCLCKLHHSPIMN
jgi:hypothetical protein